ncbi:MAG TPA: lysine biosynthesis protein LysX [Pseudonocardiaceae bacterium]
MITPADGPLVALVLSRIRVEEKLILAALAARGLAHVTVDDRRLAVRLDDPPPRWDIVLNRSLSAQRRLLVSELCQMWGLPVVNRVDVVRTCDDKIATSIALHRDGLPVPITAIALSPAAGSHAIESVGYPAVVKPVNGSWGRMLARVNDPDAAEFLLAHRQASASPQLRVIYAQEFVRTPGRDIRVLVAGSQVIAAAYRESAHWAANRALGATMRSCRLTGELEKLAIAAATAVGGGVVGVDLLERDDGLLVNEVNSAPEFAGLAETCDVDIGDALVSYALAEAGG